MEIQDLYHKYLENQLVSTDTRNIAPGSMFFALKGPNFNANKFAGQALEQGASCVVVDELYDQEKLEGKFFFVEDVLTTLQDLAHFHRKQLNIPFIGITGSNGKTTTKELVYAVLSKKYNTLATKGNLNNHIGVPLTLLSIRSDVEIAIIEMGANKLGDIAELCDITIPTHGLITNIGRAHIGCFGGFENIIRGKSELYHFLIRNNGKVWINSQNPILKNMVKRFVDPMLYPAKGDYLECELLDALPFVRYRDEQGQEVLTNLVGEYNFENIAAALGVGKYFGVPPSDANEAIANYTPSNNRSQVLKKGTNTIILDAYNANPSSMESAILNLVSMDGERKVLILGDMYELGDESDVEHANLGKMVKEQGFKDLYLCGKLIKPALKECPEAKYFEDKESLSAFLQSQKYKDTLFLLKASRSIGLETVVGAIE